MNITIFVVQNFTADTRLCSVRIVNKQHFSKYSLLCRYVLRNVEWIALLKKTTSVILLAAPKVEK